MRSKPSFSDTVSGIPASGVPVSENASSGISAAGALVRGASSYKGPSAGALPSKASVLRDIFGYASFRPGQERIIDTILSGRDVLGIMPTGAGKSLCYQVPALLMPGITIVVSPLISLMCDQVKTLNRKHVHAAWLNSSLTPAQLRKACRLAAEGFYKLIYLSPERLLTPAFISLASRMKISMLCVDEAHCICQWGEEFRPAYRRIPEFISALPVRPIVCAFTATATPAVRDDVIHFLDLHRPSCMTYGFDRPNLYYEVLHPRDKISTLRTLLARHRGECGVIYCLTRRSVETVANHLRADGVPVTCYHGGLTREMREMNQAAWLSGESPVIVATNAFGMGIDKPDVRFVIHYNMPGELEEYYQEAGRAGRDGQHADCIMFSSYRDVVINEFFLRSSEKNEEDGHSGGIAADNGNRTDAGGDRNGRNRADAAEEHAVKKKPERKFSPSDRRSAAQHMRHKREKLHAMMRYAGGHRCLRAFMLEYFGEHAGSFCGNCSVCLSLPSPAPAAGISSAAPPAGGIGRTLFRPKTRTDQQAAFGCSADEDPELYQHLRSCRLRLADRIGKVPAAVFSDQVLHHMAAAVPVSWFSLFLISGMNPVKCIKYGAEFLPELRAWNDSFAGLLKHGSRKHT